MKQRVILLILLVSLFMAGCSSRNSNNNKEDLSSTGSAELLSRPTSEPITITIAIQDWELSYYENLVKAFEEANPDIHVKLRLTNDIVNPDDSNGEWPSDGHIRIASAADVLSFGASRTYVDADLIYDLTPLIDSDPHFDIKDFYPGTLENYQWDGGSWSLPINLTYTLILFNKDIFDQAGLAYPQPGWTWEEFRDIASVLTTQDASGTTTQWGFVLPWPNHTPYILGRVGTIFDESSIPLTPRFEAPEVVEAVRFYTNLFLVDKVSPFFPPPSLEENDEASASTFNLPEGLQLIEQSRAAMWPDSWEVYKGRSQNENIGVVPFPVDNEGSHSTPLFISGMSMSAGTQNPQAAWKWMMFVLQQGGDGINLPSRPSVAEAIGFWENIGEESAATLHFAVNHSYSFHTHNSAAFFWQAINRILSREQLLEDALSQAQSDALEQIVASELATSNEITPTPHRFIVTTPEEDQTDLTTIRFITGNMGGDLQSYNDLAKQFESEYPGTKVEILQLSDLRKNEILRLADIAENSDCFQWYPSFQSQNNLDSVMSLDPFLDADPSISENDFYPVLLDEFTWQGQLLGFPAEASPYIIEYNKDLFDSVGLGYPSNNWTINEFLTIAISLTSGEGSEKVWGFVGGEHETSAILLFIEQMSGQIVDETTDPGNISIVDPQVVEAVRWYSNLALKYEVNPIYNINDETYTIDSIHDPIDLINTNHAGMWISVGGYVSSEQSLSRVGVVSIPAGSGSNAGGYAFVNGYFISSSTQVKEQCWDWIKFLTESPNMVSGLPARLSVSQSDAYEQQVGSEYATAYNHSITNAQHRSGQGIFSNEQAWMWPASYWIRDAYMQIVTQGMDPGTALLTGQDKFDAYRACIIDNNAFDTEKLQIQCLQEVDPTIPVISDLNEQ